MPALIQSAIPQRKYELIRDRIADVLALELPSQATLNDDANLDANIFVERSIPIDKTQMPAVNVMLSVGDFNAPATHQSGARYTYFVDVYTSAKSSAESNGDKTSATMLHRLLGVITAILEDPQYRTLGFTPPSISHTNVSLMNILEPQNKQDAESVIMGRLSFDVVVVEEYELITPIPLALSITEVRIANSDEGYGYEAEPKGDCKPVDVTVCDEDGNVIATYSFEQIFNEEIEVFSLFEQQLTVKVNGRTIYDDVVDAEQDINFTLK
jgi:hypothetical protein